MTDISDILASSTYMNINNSRESCSEENLSLERVEVEDEKNTIVKCTPLYCYCKTFFTDRVLESYLRTTAVKSRGK